MKGGRLVPVVVSVALGLLVLPQVAAADSFPRVMADVGLTTQSKSPVRDDAIPAVTIDPDDPQHIVVATGDFRAGRCGIYFSTDGGATFTAGKTSPIPRGFDNCTPDAGAMAFPMAWSKDGSLLLSFVVFNNKAEVFDGPASVVLARTHDNGTTWQTTIVRDNQTRTPVHGAWQVHMVSDPATDTVYVGWQERNVENVKGWSAPTSRAYLAVSTDGGKTFGTPIDIISGNKGVASEFSDDHGPSLALAPDGSLYAQYIEGTGFDPTVVPQELSNLPVHLVLAHTSDKGHTFTYSNIRERGDFTDFPEIAVAKQAGGSSYSVVVSYEDLAAGPAGDQQIRDIYAQYSTDHGAHWSDRVRVTDDNLAQNLSNKFVPGIAAAPNGRIDVAWIDFRNDTGSLLSDAYMASSTDGGAHWSANRRLSSKSSDRHYGQFANYSDVRGPVGVASSNYAGVAAWDDSRLASASLDVQDVFFGGVQTASVPASSNTVLAVIASVGGGLIAAALILVGAGLVIRRRRETGAKTLVAR